MTSWATGRFSKRSQLIWNVPYSNIHLSILETRETQMVQGSVLNSVSLCFFAWRGTQNKWRNRRRIAPLCNNSQTMSRSVATPHYRPSVCLPACAPRSITQPSHAPQLCPQLSRTNNKSLQQEDRHKDLRTRQLLNRDSWSCRLSLSGREKGRRDRRNRGTDRNKQTASFHDSVIPGPSQNKPLKATNESGRK